MFSGGLWEFCRDETDDDFRAFDAVAGNRDSYGCRLHKQDKCIGVFFDQTSCRNAFKVEDINWMQS